MKLPAFTGDLEVLADALVATFLKAYLEFCEDPRNDMVKIICLLGKNQCAQLSRTSREDNSNITLMRFDINTKPLNLGLPTQVVPVYRHSAPTEVGRLTDVTVEELNFPAGLNEEQEVQTQQLVHDRLKSAVKPRSIRVHFVESGDVDDLSQVVASDSAEHQSEENRVDENLELRSDTETQRALQVRQGLGRAFAWLYVVERVLPVLESLRIQGSELVREFPNMLMKLVIVLSEPLGASRPFIQVKGFVGTGSQKNRNVCRCDVYELRDQENDIIHHIVVDEPYPAIILKSMYEEGKLSNQAYKTELRNFFSGLVEILEESALESCIIQDDEFCVNEKEAGKGRALAEWLLSTVRKYNQGFVDESECDTELDGPETCVLESIPVDTKTVSALSTAQTVESCYGILYVLDKGLGQGAGSAQNWSWKMQLNTEAEELRTDVPPISTVMILTAAKEIGLIGDLNFREITVGGRCSSLQQTRIAIDLVLYWSLRYSVRYKMLLDKLTQMLFSATNVSSFQPQPNATDSKGKLLEERKQIFMKVLFTMITDKKYYPYDFELQLRKLAFNLKFDVSQLQNENGESLLHAIVICNRQSFCLPLFRLGCWKDIYPKRVEMGRGSAYEDKTADEICAVLKYPKMRKELDSFVVWEKSLNLILTAARIGNFEEVKRMLDYSSDLHLEQDSMGCTSLYWGVVGGNERVVDLLLSLNVDHNIVNSRKESLLHIACVLGHDHLIRKLVLHLKMDYSIKDGAKKSALQRVAENGDEKCLAQFFECGLGVDKLESVLAVAGHFGRLNFIRTAVEKYHVDPQSKDEAGKSAFLRAAEQGKVEVLKYVMSKKFDFTETDNRRRNVLHLVADGATKDAMEFIIKELKDRNVDVKTMINERDKYIGGELCMLIRGKDGGRDSWHYVEVSRGLVSLFLKRTRGGTVDVGRYGTLLSSGWGVDPDNNAVKDIEKRFEARRASMSTDPDVTPLHIAAFREKLDLAIILLESGADPNIRDKFGLSALHTAAMRGNLALVKLLLNKGAASDALDNLVKTPVDVADDNEHNDVATYIRSQKYLQPVEAFRDRTLRNVQRLLGAEQIERMRTEGHDIRSYFVNTLRDLAVNINEALVSLDSGPVLEETSS